MTTHDVRLLARDEIAAGTMAFHLSRPEGFTFKPGQAIDVLIGDAAEAANDNNRHTFSVVSAPSESDLVVATRMRDSAFKRALGGLPVGSSLRIDGPSGSLTLHRDVSRGAVMIAGGIGITPFVSMLRHAAGEKSARQLVLLYSNRAPKDTAFLQELSALAQTYPGFRLLATMTEAAQSAPPWTGETRFIGVELLDAARTGLAAPIYYVAGPPALVQAVRATLESAGVSDDDVRSEEFYGY